MCGKHVRAAVNQRGNGKEESGLEKLFQLGTRCVCWSVGRVHRYQDVKVKFCAHEACKKDATLLYITTLSALSNLLLCSC